MTSKSKSKIKNSNPYNTNKRNTWLAIGIPCVLFVGCLGYFSYRYFHPQVTVLHKNTLPVDEIKEIHKQQLSARDNLVSQPFVVWTLENQVDKIQAILKNPKNNAEREQWITQNLHFAETLTNEHLQKIHDKTWALIFKELLHFFDPSLNQKIPPKTQILSSRFATKEPFLNIKNRTQLLLSLAQNKKQDENVKYILLEGLVKTNPVDKKVADYLKKLIRMPRPIAGTSLAQIMTQMTDQKTKETILYDYIDYLPKVPENARIYWLSNYSSIPTSPSQEIRLIRSFQDLKTDLSREALVEFIRAKKIKNPDSIKILNAIAKETKKPEIKLSAEELLRH